MSIKILLRRSLAATSAVAVMVSPTGAVFAARPAPKPHAAARMTAHVAQLPAGSQRPTSEVLLSIGEGEMVNLPANVADVWTSNPGVADVYVNNAHQINLYGKAFGEATVFATSASGTVVYATSVRVSQNITSIDRMLKVAMPDANIKVTTVGQIAVLTGTVASPDDSAQAQQLVTSLLNPGSDPSSTTGLKIAVVNRLRTATPLQVMLQVRFSEVSKSFAKNIGVNLQTYDSTGGFKFGIGQGRAATQYTPNGSLFVNGSTPSAGTTGLQIGALGSTLGFAGKLLGMNFLSALDLGERDGQVTTLASPTLSAISGETATFLAGGEIPIPVAQGGSNGAVSVEFKEYGVSLAFTPTVLSDGRISLRVRPEVSQLTTQGAVQIGGTSIPGISTRRVETTVELGSGESMTIGGLISNTHNNSINKAPGIGDVPVLGALFRSNAFQRDETELVVVVTPYLVKPVNANAVVLPTDGYQAPTDLGRVFLGQLSTGTTGGDRPKPTVAIPVDAAPAIGANAPVLPAAVPVAPMQPRRRDDAPGATIVPAPQPKKGTASAAPGFNL